MSGLDPRRSLAAESREHFWQGLLAGLAISTAFVAAFVAFVARLRGRPTSSEASPGSDRVDS